MKNLNKLFETLLSIYRALEELLPYIISSALTLATLGVVIAFLVMFYKTVSLLLFDTL